jgi:hypothetical protein
MSDRGRDVEPSSFRTSTGQHEQTTRELFRRKLTQHAKTLRERELDGHGERRGKAREGAVGGTS